MTRAAILPDTGDPFVLLFWLRFYEKYWKNEIDSLYIAINSPVEEEVISYMVRLVEKYPKTKLSLSREIVQHGDTIAHLLPQVTEDAIMIIENDAPVFKSGKVKEGFDFLEQGFDLVGSDRGSASQNLIKRGQQVFGLLDGENKDRYPHFFPCFFFAKKEWYLNTDRWFNARSWKAGDRIEQLDWLVEPDPGTDVITGDTFVWASIQMMAKHPKVKYVHQYHASPDDFWWRDNRQYIWGGECGWIHFGSVSTGTMGVLVNDEGIPLQNRKSMPFDSRFKNGSLSHIFDSEPVRKEYEKRVAYWQMCYEVVGEEVSRSLPDFSQAYKKAIDRVIRDADFKLQRVKDWVSLYRNLLEV